MTMDVTFGRAPETTTGGLMYNKGYAWALAAKSRYSPGELSRLCGRIGYSPYDKGIRDAVEGKPQAWKG